MAEFQWWLLLAGLAAGGGLVAVVFMDGARREADLAEDERRAEATWIAGWLADEGRVIPRPDVDAVLRAHREYLGLPPPDRFQPVPSSADRDADRQTDDVRHDRGGGPDQDLPAAGEQQASPGQ